MELRARSLRMDDQTWDDLLKCAKLLGFEKNRSLTVRSIVKEKVAELKKRRKK